MLYKRILGSTFIVSTLLLNNVLGFSIRLFSPGFDITAGSSTSFVFEGDSPKLVSFKIAVQNKDNTLTSIESFSAPNTTPGDFVHITIPSGVQAGINYWFIAVDSTNESNYATLGPRVIRKMFDSNNPTASITADSGSAYKTDGGPAPSSTAKTTPNGSVAFPTDLFPSNMFPNGVYPTGTVTNKDLSGNTNSDDRGISIGTIIGIVAGGFVLFAITICVVYCCCLNKAIKTLSPVVDKLTGPKYPKQESSIPIVSAPSTAVIASENHKSPVSPSVTLVNPLNQDVHIKPGATSTPNTTEYSFSASNENVYNNQYPPAAHSQSSYPSYPYPYSPKVQSHGLPYPSQDFMPTPDHFNDGLPPYPPFSATMQNNNTFPFQQQQQQYPSYGNQQHQEMQQSESIIVPMTESNTFVYPPVAAGVGVNQFSKTEHVQIPIMSAVFNQKVEYNQDVSDKVEHNQKPDTTEHSQKPDEAVMYNKPNSDTVQQQYNKPHEKEL